jgi:uncharacterized protein (DUF488 family)
MRVQIFTLGHGVRPTAEFLATVTGAGVETVVDVRRLPRSRRNPQYNQASLRAAVEDAGIAYVHEVELGGLRENEPGEERFPCIRVPAFRSYAARMGSPAWEEALARVLAAPAPALMCAETPWQRCHRRMISELLTARGHDVIHLLHEGGREPHHPGNEADVRDGKLYLCGALVA